LRTNAHWARIISFYWSLNGEQTGHAVVLYQPTPTSNVFLYDKAIGGSKDLGIQSHDLAEIVNSIKSIMKAGVTIEEPHWIDWSKQPRWQAGQKSAPNFQVNNPNQKMKKDTEQNKRRALEYRIQRAMTGPSPFRPFGLTQQDLAKKLGVDIRKPSSDAKTPRW
jgi:hypothetical protein